MEVVFKRIRRNNFLGKENIKIVYFHNNI